MSSVPALHASLADALADEHLIGAELREVLGALPVARQYRLLLDEGHVSEAVARRTADYLGIEFVAGEQARISPEARDLLVKLDALEPPVLPLARTDDYVVVGIVDPFDIDVRDRLQARIGLPVRLLLVSPETVDRLRQTYAGTINHLQHLGEGFQFQDAVEDSDSDEIDENSAPVVKLVNTLLREAVAKRASDIHIESGRQSTVLRYRIDGVLQEAMAPIGRELHEPLISRMKVMADLDITEKRIPQDGRFQHQVNGKPVDFRVSVLPSIDSEDAVIRVLDRRSIPGDLDYLALDALGFEAEQLRLLRRALDRPSGMVIATGPTGSGKTTTLYGALNEISSGEVKTITIEDPVEYRLLGIIQIPVNDKKGLTFARGLRSILRHDPDRIMVGEVRDQETAEIAVHSALTGHLVLTTLHANNVLDVINRLGHLGLDRRAFLPSLSCIVSQRLLRKLCDHCKAEGQAAPEQRLELGVPDGLEGRTWYEPRGCEQCHGTGYSGRTVVAEVLLLDMVLQEYLTGNPSYSGFLSAAQAQGFTPIREAAIAKAAAGVTSLAEIKRVIGAV